MAKRYAITLNFQEREVRYRLPDRRALEEKYRKGLMKLLQEDVLATEGRKSTLGGLLDVQYDVIWMGLRHLGGAVTEKKVKQWLDELIERADDSYGKLLGTCCDAIAASGILGIKFEAPDEESEEPGAAGKEPASEPSNS